MHKVKPILKRIQALFCKEGIPGDFSLENIIFNKVHPDINNVCNTITLIGKQYIYRCKCQSGKPTYGGPKAEIILNYNIEIWNSYINCNTTKVKKKWGPVVKIFNIVHIENVLKYINVYVFVKE